RRLGGAGTQLRRACHVDRRAAVGDRSVRGTGEQPRETSSMARRHPGNAFGAPGAMPETPNRIAESEQVGQRGVGALQLRVAAAHQLAGAGQGGVELVDVLLPGALQAGEGLVRRTLPVGGDEFLDLLVELLELVPNALGALDDLPGTVLDAGEIGGDLLRHGCQAPLMRICGDYTGGRSRLET